MLLRLLVTAKRKISKLPLSPGILQLAVSQLDAVLPGAGAADLVLALSALLGLEANMPVPVLQHAVQRIADATRAAQASTAIAALHASQHAALAHVLLCRASAIDAGCGLPCMSSGSSLGITLLL